MAAINGTNLGASGGGSGLADTYVQPLNLGWHFKRDDFNVGYAFTAPTGRYTAGADDNVGSGYWGNNTTNGTTFYITKNKGTSANLFTDWEIHGQRKAASMSASPCAVNVPRTPQTREFFEVFEGTSGPSVRAFVVGKGLIHLGERHFLQGCKA